MNSPDRGDGDMLGGRRFAMARCMKKLLHFAGCRLRHRSPQVGKCKPCTFGGEPLGPKQKVWWGAGCRLVTSSDVLEFSRRAAVGCRSKSRRLPLVWGILFNHTIKFFVHRFRFPVSSITGFWTIHAPPSFFNDRPPITLTSVSQ